MFKYLEGVVNALKLLQLKFTVVWVTALLALNSFVTRSRMSHENGIVTRGELRIVDEPTFPRNEFFTPGTEFPCRMRFGAATWKDDAKMVIRGAGLKFADDRTDVAARPPAQQWIAGDLLERPHLHRLHARHHGRPREELDAVPRPAPDGPRRWAGRHAARSDLDRARSCTTPRPASV